MCLSALRLKAELERIVQSRCSTQSLSTRPSTGKSSVSQKMNFNERLKLLRELLERSQKPRGLQRCRPRIPKLLVTVSDPYSSARTQRDVAYLQDYPDRMRALRECIEVMFGSSTKVFRKLDVTGSGTLSLSDLDKGLRSLRIPWQQVTGLTRVEFFKLLGGGGRVDILEFLGKPGLTSRPHWSQLSLLDQWEDYCKKVIDLDLTNLEYNPPLWNGISTPSAATPLTVVDPNHAAQRLAREDLEVIQSKVVRIEKFLNDFAENKRDLGKLRMDLASVTEGQERQLEIRRQREEEEREKQRIKTAAGMALVTNGDTKISIFGKKNVLSVFEQPEDLEHAFDLESLVSPDEIAFREMVRRSGLSLSQGDRVREAFAAHASDRSSLSSIEFDLAIRCLLGIPAAQPAPRLAGFWTTVAKGRSRVCLEDVLTFCARTVFNP